MKIRQYEINDRKQCLELFKSNTPLFFDPTELPDFEIWLNGQDEGRLAYKQTEVEYFFVAELDNRIVACGGYYIPRAERRANMVWGMVHNEEHRKGVGSKLMEFRIQQIQAFYPNNLISLDTTQHSFQFFEKIGFIITKITNDYYAKGLHRYDMIKNN
jgi:[ribosomal protein S18]-alanine N-acetyltransferase